MVAKVGGSTHFSSRMLRLVRYGWYSTYSTSESVIVERDRRGIVCVGAVRCCPCCSCVPVRYVDSGVVGGRQHYTSYSTEIAVGGRKK